MLIIEKKLRKADKWDYLCKVSEGFEKLFSKINSELCSNCIEAAKDQHNTFISKERGCCTSCASKNGYLYEGCVKDGKKQLKELKKEYNFSQEYGFFDIVNHKCGLPRIFRSNVCVSYHCLNYYENRVEYGAKYFGLMKRKLLKFLCVEFRTIKDELDIIV